MANVKDYVKRKQAAAKKAVKERKTEIKPEVEANDGGDEQPRTDV